MFRILCLDGGGILGAFTASVLEELENSTGQAISTRFDLIAGTSTGGILALGLALGFSASELRAFYEERGRNIFPHTSRFSRARAAFRQLFRPKLDQGPLLQELYQILGDRRFGEAQSRLIIPTFDAVEGRIYVFKTAHDPRFVNDLDIPAVEVALATSAAPTYFSAARSATRTGAQYVDGGVWANNPSMVALIEAIAILGHTPDEIALLSVGTTTTPFSISKHENSGAMSWNVGLIDLLMRGQAEAAAAQASLLLGDRYHRIDFVATEGQFSMDDGRQDKISDLVALGRNQAQKRRNLQPVSELFLNDRPVEPFQPVSRRAV
ncbi:MAG: CBASS cGAMP-activated phospholipase [Roseovarius confluentis]|uniref:CBASS cGAMP-activated phospholipase n=1 Tax=Roseovarius sp. TaxID=1486281 RepID=UPI0032EE8CFD